MGRLFDVSKEIYNSIECSGRFGFGYYWNSEDIKELLRYDVVRLTSLLCVFGTQNERDRMKIAIDSLFENDESSYLGEYLDTYSGYKTIESILFDLPVTIRLLNSISDDRYSECMKWYEGIMVGIVYSDDNLEDNTVNLLMRVYFCCMKNILNFSYFFVDMSQ